MSLWTEHLVIAPVVVPLAAGALLLLYDERRRKLKAAIGLLRSPCSSAQLALLARATTFPRASMRSVTGPRPSASCSLPTGSRR